MSEPKPPMVVTLEWDSALEFTGQAGKHEVGIDGNTYSAASPMQYLALGLLGCMAIDLVHILKKQRREIASFEARFVGERSPEEPHRFVKITLHFVLTGDMTDEQVERALQLSRDKYCSVWNSLRQDIELTTTHELVAPQV